MAGFGLALNRDHASTESTPAPDTWLRPAGTAALIAGDQGDPFGILGPHTCPDETHVVVRTLQPGADRVSLLLNNTAEHPIPLECLDPAGFFAGLAPAARVAAGYRLRVHYGAHEIEIEDPYRFGPLLAKTDIHLIAEGSHWQLYDALGAHFTEIDGVTGTRFAVWAPNARRVSVVGDFNHWDGRRNSMRLRPECGVWEMFAPGVAPGTLYKYEIKARNGALFIKADPLATNAELPPATASRVVAPSVHRWADTDWMASRARANDRSAPITIYEVHLGSWRRKKDRPLEPLDYRDLASTLVPYVRELGFTHIELLPISEFPFDGSWGYQPSGLFAPTSRFGTPDDFRAFVDACHAGGIGVLLDWVPAHFPSDAHGLVRFDGTCLYEHEDERKGRHKEWDTLIYNYSRREVANFLIANALYWLKEFHLDGLRVDAVSSMLYLDYGREPGEWEANAFGGNENLEAIDFLKRLNTEVYAQVPGVVTIAEESTSWPMVSQPVDAGGLGFGYKWNMGWMNDTLRYMRRDPIHRRHHHDDLTFGMLYAYSENFILPLSHDEVVHLKGSLLDKMPGDSWRKFANLRLYLAFMCAYPGKKLLFMGAEFAQTSEWDHDRALNWEELDDPMHRGVQSLVGDLNRLYRELPALHELDCVPDGFHWIDCQDKDNNIVAFLRRAASDNEIAVAVCNFSPVVREGYRIGVPRTGFYRERINTDGYEYGGAGVGNLGRVESESTPWHGLAHSLVLTLPPLATVVLTSSGTAPSSGGRD
ncbi:MAG: 1,4-alpha-glucan branching protein GlgB [Alphaproteobacteria bacterium]